MTVLEHPSLYMYGVINIVIHHCYHHRGFISISVYHHTIDIFFLSLQHHHSSLSLLLLLSYSWWASSQAHLWSTWPWSSCSSQHQCMYPACWRGRNQCEEEWSSCQHHDHHQMIMFMYTIQRVLINLFNFNVPVKIGILDKLSIYKARDLIDIFSIHVRPNLRFL